MKRYTRRQHDPQNFGGRATTHLAPSIYLDYRACVIVKPKLMAFLDPEGGSQNVTLVVLLVLVVVVVVISSPKIPKAFLIHSGAQRNFAHTHSCS